MIGLNTLGVARPEGELDPAGSGAKEALWAEEFVRAIQLAAEGESWRTNGEGPRSGEGDVPPDVWGSGNRGERDLGATSLGCW